LSKVEIPGSPSGIWLNGGHRQAGSDMNQLDIIAGGRDD